jgi:hypothetical protein
MSLCLWSPELRPFKGLICHPKSYSVRGSNSVWARGCSHGVLRGDADNLFSLYYNGR